MRSLQVSIVSMSNTPYQRHAAAAEAPARNPMAGLAADAPDGVRRCITLARGGFGALGDGKTAQGAELNPA